MDIRKKMKEAVDSREDIVYVKDKKEEINNTVLNRSREQLKYTNKLLQNEEVINKIKERGDEGEKFLSFYSDSKKLLITKGAFFEEDLKFMDGERYVLDGRSSAHFLLNFVTAEIQERNFVLEARVKDLDVKINPKSQHYLTKKPTGEPDFVWKMDDGEKVYLEMVLGYKEQDGKVIIKENKINNLRRIAERDKKEVYLVERILTKELEIKYRVFNVKEDMEKSEVKLGKNSFKGNLQTKQKMKLLTEEEMFKYVKKDNFIRSTERKMEKIEKLKKDIER